MFVRVPSEAARNTTTDSFTDRVVPGRRHEKRAAPAGKHRGCPQYETSLSLPRHGSWIVSSLLRDERAPLLLRGLVGSARGGRQLQDGRALTSAQSREQHDLPAGEFERIVIHVRLVVVDLPEPSHFFPNLSVREEGPKRSGVFHFVLERELRAGKKAHCHRWLFHCSEAASDRVGERRRYQFVSHPSGSGCNVVKTVVTHGRCSSCCEQPGGLSSLTTPKYGGDPVSPLPHPVKTT